MWEAWRVQSMLSSSECFRYTAGLGNECQHIVNNTWHAIESICFSYLGSRVCFIKYDYKHIPRRNIITFFFFAKMFLFLHMIFTGQPLNSIQHQGLFAYIYQITFFPFTFVITTVWSLSYRQIEINLQKVSRHILLLLFSVWLIQFFEAQFWCELN